MAGNLPHLPTHLVSGTLLPSSTCTNGSATNVVCHVTHIQHQRRRPSVNHATSSYAMWVGMAVEDSSPAGAS